MSTEPRLSLEAATKRYGAVTALHPLTLAWPAGMYGVAGHNGAGKPTLFRLLAGLDVPSAGRVQVAGADPVRAAGRVAFAPAHLPLAQLRARDYLYALQAARGQPHHTADAA